MPKLNLKKSVYIEDKDGVGSGFGPGEVEVTQEQEKQIKERFPAAIIAPKAAGDKKA